MGTLQPDRHHPVAALDPGHVLSSALRGAVRRFGDRVAVSMGATLRVSYRELDVAADELAAGMIARGVGPGDRVALCLPNSPEFVALYIAAARVGATTVGINPALSAAQRRGIAAQVRPKIGVGTSTFIDDFRDLAEVVSLDSVGCSAMSMVAALRASASKATTVVGDPVRPVAIVFTSGSSGRPKGAVFENRQLHAVAQLEVGDEWGALGAVLIATPFAHVGFMTKLPWYLQGGASMHVLARWRPADALQIVVDNGMAVVGGVAPQIALLVEEQQVRRLDVSKVRQVVAGGGQSSPELIRRARRTFGATYRNRYSCTESAGIGTDVMIEADEDASAGTVGWPRPGVEIEIRDETGLRLTGGEVGRIHLRSPFVMSGYFEDEEATLTALPDGWLRTDDLGSLDGHGRLRIAGRSSRTFIRGGYNVHPELVESVLLSHPDVTDIAVVPRPDEVMGELSVAFVVAVNPASPPTLADLRDFARERLAGYELPDFVEPVASLPFTAMHKLDWRQLSVWAEDGPPEGAGASTPRRTGAGEAS